MQPSQFMKHIKIPLREVVLACSWLTKLKFNLCLVMNGEVESCWWSRSETVFVGDKW
jgi:hypothetical protein